MKGFIEVRTVERYEEGTVYLRRAVRIDSIDSFQEARKESDYEGFNSIIYHHNGLFYIQESYDEVIRLIEEARND